MMTRSPETPNATMRPTPPSPALVAVRLDFTGRFVTDSFAAFLAHRAGRLALEQRIEAIGTDRVVVVVAGHADLVDAYEMAASLGPIDCLVHDVGRRALEPGDERDR